MVRKLIRLTYFQDRKQLALLETDLENEAWFALDRLLSEYNLDDFEKGDKYIQLPWWDFEGKWPDVEETLDFYEHKIEVSPEAKTSWSKIKKGPQFPKNTLNGR